MLNSEELQWLSDNPEAIERTQNMDLSAQSLISDVGALKKDYGDYARSVVELVQARRATQGKLPEGWWLDTESAQQATPYPVALFRAQHLIDLLGRDALYTDVTCSIGTEAHALINTGAQHIVVSDIEYPRVLCAVKNTQSLSIQPTAVQADALAPVIQLHTEVPPVVIADPARRTGGSRITRVEDLIPPLPDLVDTYTGSASLAIKCAPGIDYSGWEGHVDVVSLNGGVKEVTLYSENLRPRELCLETPTPFEPPVSQTRRAVILRADSAENIMSIRMYDSTMPIHEPTLYGEYGEKNGDSLAGENTVTGENTVGTYIIEPDGAVIRAGLVQQYAGQHDLHMIDPHIAFLTGDSIPEDTIGYRVVEELSLKNLKAAVARYGVHSLEILVRGADIDPDQLRKKLKLKPKPAKRPQPDSSEELVLHYPEMTAVIARVGTGSQSTVKVWICEAQRPVLPKTF